MSFTQQPGSDQVLTRFMDNGEKLNIDSETRNTVLSGS